MTERGAHAPKRRSRWTKGRIRVLAWTAGVATFAASGVALAAVPKPTVGATKRARHRSRPVIERTIIRRVIVVDPAAPVTSAPVIVSSGSSGGSTAVAAPAPAPTTTGGS